MRLIIIMITIMSFCTTNIRAQVGINTTDPEAMLDLRGTLALPNLPNEIATYLTYDENKKIYGTSFSRPYLYAESSETTSFHLYSNINTPLFSGADGNVITGFSVGIVIPIFKDIKYNTIDVTSFKQGQYIRFNEDYRVEVLGFISTIGRYSRGTGEIDGPLSLILNVETLPASEDPETSSSYRWRQHGGISVTINYGFSGNAVVVTKLSPSIVDAPKGTYLRLRASRIHSSGNWALWDGQTETLPNTDISSSIFIRSL